MNSKEIELVLQARLEAGDSEAKAGQIGDAIARALGDALEGAFDQIGERIAESLHRSIMTKMGSLDFSGIAGKIQIPGAGVGGGPPLPPLMTGGPLINPHTNRPFPRAFGSAGESNAAIDGQREQLQNQTAEEQAHQSTQSGDQSKEKMLLEFLKGRGGRRKRSSIYSHGLESLGPNQGLEAFSGAVDDVAHEANRQADASISRFRVEKQLSKIDPSFKMSDETFENAKKARVQSGDNAKMAAAKLEETNKTIGKLETVLDRNSKAVEALEKSMKKAVEGGNLEEAEKLKASIERKEGRGKDLQNTLDEKVYQKGRAESQINATASIAKEVDQEIAARQQAEEAAAAAKANSRARLMSQGLGLGAAALAMGSQWSLSRMQGEAGAAKIANFEGRRLMNDDYSGQIGDQMAGGTDEMRSRARTSAWMGLGANILGGAATGAIGGSIIPGLGTVAGAVVGGIGGAVKSVIDYNKMDDTVAGHMQAQSGMKQEQFAEYIKMYGAARERGIGKYEQAQGMGDARMSNFLYGGQSDMMMSGVQQGLSRGSVDQVLGTVAGSMGNYEALSSSSFQEELKRGMGMKAKGFSNFEQVAGGMFAGGSYSGDTVQDRTKALKDSEEMYTRAFAAGLNQSKIPEALADVASKAASGLGAGEAAMSDLTQSAFIAKDVLGRDYEGKELDVVKRTRDTMRGTTMGESGLGFMAGMDATSAFEDKYGIKLDDGQRLMMQQGELSEKGLREMLSPEDIAKISAKEGGGKDAITKALSGQRNQQVASERKIMDEALQTVHGDKASENMATYMYGKTTGARTVEEFNLAGKAARAEGRDATPEEIKAAEDKLAAQGGQSAVGKNELKQREQTAVTIAMDGLTTLGKTTDLLAKDFENLRAKLAEISKMPMQRGGAR